MHTRLEILPDAIFIADAHFSTKRAQFLTFLQEIDSGKIKATQLFLLGDCFDFLSSSIAYSVLVNRKAVKLLRKISQKMPVFYFEGNHDFNLQKIFPDVIVYSFGNQPALFYFNNQRIILMHGDKFESWHYRLYAYLVRCDFLLRAINLLSLEYKNNNFVKKLYIFLENKSICRKNENFLNYRLAKITNLALKRNADAIIEGHFHQNLISNKYGFSYVNLSAFACDKSFFKVQSSDIFELTEIALKEEL